MAGRLIGGNISFDHAADIYDVTRALPEDVAHKLTDALVAGLAAVGADHALEVGIGTGRIARPLAGRGIRVCGVDISPRMLVRLRDQLGPQHLPPDLALGDTTQLPIASGSFRAVLVFNVLHLVSSPERAVQELRRVIAPGGVVIQGNTRYQGQQHWAASMERWDDLLARRDCAARRRLSVERVHATLRALGGSCRLETVAEGEERRTPAQNLDRIRGRIDSWSWEIPDDVFADCFAEFEPWYRAHYVEMDRELAQPVSYELEVWSFR